MPCVSMVLSDSAIYEENFGKRFVIVKKMCSLRMILSFVTLKFMIIGRDARVGKCNLNVMSVSFITFAGGFVIKCCI